jgi:dTDP-glucose pyrophosphorylase
MHLRCREHGRWIGNQKMLNIVMPIAGRGQRFIDAGFLLPKPLIPIHGVPMVEVVVNNIRPRQPHRFTFLALRDHLNRSGLEDQLNRIAPGCSIIPVEKVTEGAACTVLLAREIINTDHPMMIVNTDQWIAADINSYLGSMESSDAGGLIMTMWADDPKWSYVEIDRSGYASRVVEKQVVSNHATVGIYNFRHGCDFVRSAAQMIKKGLRVNGEFYVAPVYNELMNSGAKIATFDIGRYGHGMYGIGTPSDLEQFLRLVPPHKAIGRGDRAFDC